jgi:acyl-CoA oxidase
MSLDLPGCFAMTETGHGSDVQSIRTTATYDPAADEFVIHTPTRTPARTTSATPPRTGAWPSCSPAGDTRDEPRRARLPRPHPRRRRPAAARGVTIEDCGHKAGLNGVDNGRLWFDQVRVPARQPARPLRPGRRGRHLLSPIDDETKRFFTMLGTLVQGRISVSGGRCQRDQGRRWPSRPVRPGPPPVQGPRGRPRGRPARLPPAPAPAAAPRLATTYALHFAQESLVAELHDLVRRAARLEATRTERRCSSPWPRPASRPRRPGTPPTPSRRAARPAAGPATCREPAPQLKADTDVFTTFEGDNTVLLQLVAKGLLTDFRDEFGRSTPRDRPVRRRPGRRDRRRAHRGAAPVPVLIDPCPAATRTPTCATAAGSSSCSSGARSTSSPGSRVGSSSGIDAGGDRSTCSTRPGPRAARRPAHIDLVVLEEFTAAIDRCEDPEVRALLDVACDLYALSEIEADRAWFMEHGRLRGWG